MRSRRSVLPVLAAVLLAMTACTNDDSPEAESGGSGGSGAGDSTGVTDDTIKLGFPALDQQALIDAGFATDIGDVTEVAQRIVDDWNAAGGIGGRQVQLVPRTFGSDIANALAQMQTVCLELTEDEQVFATVAVAWFGDAATCMAGDHDTPLVVQTSLPRAVMESGDGNIFSVNFMWEEAVRSSVRALDAAGELDGFEKIGVFAPLEPGMQEAIDDGLSAALEEAGSTLEADGTIPFAIPVDSAAVSAVVSRFKAEGVDAVFGMGNFLFNGAFMTEADKQGYQPTYVMSDLSEGTEDLILNFAPARQLDNAIGASWKGHLPDAVPTEAAQECLATYGADLPEGDVAQQLGTAQVCELLSLTRQGLEAGGEDLTRASFIAGMEGIAEFTTHGGSQAGYGPGDHTFPKQVRLVRFDLAGCECWVAEGDWIDVGD